ncbi:MAG: glycosyltransferase [Ignavibacteriales bacterium]|nr:glycosyltransferase [Ignavibacteriales bacterium]
MLARKNTYDPVDELPLQQLGAVIVNWNTRELLQRCLTSFFLEGVTRKNIVVIDQASTDGSEKHIRRLFPGIRVIGNENTGYAHAMNLGVSYVKTPFVVVSNADVVVGKDCLTGLLQEIRRDPRIGLLGCKVLDESGKHVTRFTRTSVLRGISLELVPRRLRGMWRDTEHIFRGNGTWEDVSYVEGAFMFLRRDAYLTVAGMDEGFSFFDEDVDLPIRMLKASYRICHFPDVHITHIGGASFRQAPLRHAEEFHKNLVRLYRRHALRRAVWLRRILSFVSGTKLLFLTLLKNVSLNGFSNGIAKRIQRNKIIQESLRSNSWKGAISKTPLVSVIVPTSNRPHLLSRFLARLKKQSYKHFEVIVVDQSDVEFANTMLHKVGAKPVQWKKFNVKSRALAKNAGISAASGDILLFCDDDIVPESDLIETHVNAHKKEGVGGVSCRTVEQGLSAIRTQKICKVAFYGEVIDRFQADTTCFVETLVGGNMSVKREVQREVGYFDSLYKGTSIFEEPDFSTRLKSLGLKILFTNKSTVFHEPQENGNLGTRKSNPTQYYRDFHHNEIVYFLKNRNRACLPFVVPFCLLRSLKQAALFNLPIKNALIMFSGVFDGFRSYYRSLR